MHQKICQGPNAPITYKPVANKKAKGKTRPRYTMRNDTKSAEIILNNDACLP